MAAVIVPNGSFEEQSPGQQPGDAKGWVFQSSTAWAAAGFSARPLSWPVPVYGFEPFEWAPSPVELLATADLVAALFSEEPGLDAEARETFAQWVVPFLSDWVMVNGVAGVFGSVTGNHEYDAFEWTAYVGSLVGGVAAEFVSADGTVEHESFEWWTIYDPIYEPDGQICITNDFPWTVDDRPTDADVYENFNDAAWPAITL